MFSILDTISYDNFTKNSSNIDNYIDNYINIHKIYSKQSLNLHNYVKNLSIINHSLDNYKLDNYIELAEYFPLLSLLNKDYSTWKSFNFVFKLENISLEELNVTLEEFLIIHNDITIYLINSMKNLSQQKKILYTLTLFDFICKTIKISKNKYDKLIDVVKRKIIESKETIVKSGIIDNNMYDKMIDFINFIENN
jgi:hypothetical protein